jgi:hypothetical protein
MYTVFFIAFAVSSTCFGCYLHPSSGAQLQSTAIGFVWFGVLLHWSRYWFGTALQLSTVSYRLLTTLALHVSGAICTHHQEHNCSVQPQDLYLWKTEVLVSSGVEVYCVWICV